MIKEMEPLSLTDVQKIVEKQEGKEEIQKFIKKFLKIKVEKAEELKKEIENLNIIKLKQENIIKIIDLLPEDASDLNKIFVDVSLNEDETNKILEIVKKYK